MQSKVFASFVPNGYLGYPYRIHSLQIHLLRRVLYSWNSGYMITSGEDT
jgi:hypothetical protein